MTFTILKIEKKGYYPLVRSIKPMEIPNYQRKPLVLQLQPITLNSNLELSGVVKDTETDKPLRAEINLLDTKTGEIVSLKDLGEFKLIKKCIHINFLYF